MYDSMYVYPDTIPAEDYYPATKVLVENYKKISATGKFPKHWLVFSQTLSKYYELDHEFDETGLEKNKTTNSTIKLKYPAKILWS